MIIFYNEQGDVIGTVESEFEDSFEIEGAEPIKIDQHDFTKDELKEFTTHKHKVNIEALS